MSYSTFFSISNQPLQFFFNFFSSGITHNAKQRFELTVRNQTIEDIGTRFDINAYEDEPTINTTLVEGSIRVSKGRTATILKPGQQASAASTDSAFHITAVDTDAATAWTNGYFSFDHADIKTVMCELARWYNQLVPANR